MANFMVYLTQKHTFLSCVTVLANERCRCKCRAGTCCEMLRKVGNLPFDKVTYAKKITICKILVGKICVNCKYNYKNNGY